MAQIDDTISTYLTAIEVEGKTQNTVLSYRASLEDFRRVGDRLGLPSELEAYSVEHVYRFLGDLKERGASPAYRHRRHREVKTFFSWCRRMEYVTANVFAKVPLVKLDQQIRPPFSPDEIQRLLGSLDQTDLPGCRNHALILFLLDTGVRVSECVSIRLDDVDWERLGGCWCARQRTSTTAGLASESARPRPCATTSSVSAATVQACCSCTAPGFLDTS